MWKKGVFVDKYKFTWKTKFLMRFWKLCIGICWNFDCKNTCTFLFEHPKDGTFAHVLKRGTSCNLGQNIRRRFHFLAQFLCPTSETELDYYHQKVNVRVDSRIAKWLKTYDLRKLRISKKSLKCLDLMASTQPSSLKPNLDVFR